MEEKLTSLYNTLLQIETKGDGTIKMAACLNYIVNLISELKNVKNDAEKPVEAKKSAK